MGKEARKEGRRKKVEASGRCVSAQLSSAQHGGRGLDSNLFGLRYQQTKARVREGPQEEGEEEEDELVVNGEVVVVRPEMRVFNCIKMQIRL